jgi:predicted N-acetyltransferase YhbS
MMLVGSELRIRKMTMADLPTIFPLIDKERWDWKINEVERVLEADTEDLSIVALLGDQIAGLMTVVRSQDFAFWTHVIVKEENRNHGIGMTMMQHVFEELDEKRVNTIELIAASGAVPLYEKLGFIRTEEIVCYLGESAPYSHSFDKQSLNGFQLIDLAELETKGQLETLSKKAGVDLNRILGKLIVENTAPVIGYFEENQLSGVMFTTVAEKNVELGPWLIDRPTPDAVLRMLYFAKDHFKNKSIDICVSDQNEMICNLIESEEFFKEISLVRMVKSNESIKAYPDRLIAVGKF